MKEACSTYTSLVCCKILPLLFKKLFFKFLQNYFKLTEKLPEEFEVISHLM